MTEVLAIDIGYGWAKGMTASKMALIPSLVGAAETIRYDSELIPANGDGIAVEVDGKSYFVGEWAELQSTSHRQTLDVSRTGSTEQKALFFALASELVPTNADQVAIVTGLPVDDYDDRNKAALGAMLKGQHVVKRQGKRDRRFEVVKFHIMPQAMGSLYALVTDRSGNLVDGRLANARLGILDVGTFTTNYILVDRMRYVEANSGSDTDGMSEVLVKVAKDLKREFALDWTEDLHKVDQAVRARAFEAYGEPVSIAHLVEPHIEALAETLISHARSLWSTGIELKTVILTGGGSKELAPYFGKVYPHVRTVSSDPQFANCLGFLRSGTFKYGKR